MARKAADREGQMKVFAFKQPGGGVSLFRANDGDVDSTIKGLSVKAVEIDESGLPPKDEYRDAWTLKGNKIVYDMDKAKEIKLGLVRVARAVRLASLDVEVSRALARKESAAALETERQRLRDAPSHPSIKKAKTIEDLKAADPLAKE